MGPVVDIQFAQYFLNMIFYGERADVEQRSDFVIAFPRLDMAQNLHFPVGDKLSAFPRRCPLLGFSFMEQHAHQRHMHMRHQQFEKIGMTFGQYAGNLREDEEAFRPAAGIEDPMDCHTVQFSLLEIARELPVCGAVRVLRTKEDGLIPAGAPCRQDTENDTGVRPAKLGELRFVYMFAAELFYGDRLLRAIVEYADEHGMRDEALHLALSPEKELMAPQNGGRRLDDAQQILGLSLRQSNGSPHTVFYALILLAPRTRPWYWARRLLFLYLVYPAGDARHCQAAS